jgi:F-type H+-transporting ATPase subunit gamma
VSSQQDIKRRVTSVRNTRKVTKADGAGLGRPPASGPGRIEDLRPYADAMEQLIGQTARLARGVREPLLERREVTTTAIVALTGDRGLAGAFNASVIRRAMAESRQEQGQGRSVVWMAVGKRGVGSLRFRGVDLDGVWQGFTRRPEYTDAGGVAERVVEAYRERRVDRVLLVYNSFQSAIAQTVVAQELLPFPLGDDDRREGAVEGLMTFEPAAEEMLSALLPSAVETAVYRAMLESAASEHGARMTAMRTRRTTRRT